MSSVAVAVFGVPNHPPREGVTGGPVFVSKGSRSPLVMTGCLMEGDCG
jgi:hypothetical protein